MPSSQPFVAAQGLGEIHFRLGERGGVVDAPFVTAQGNGDPHFVNFKGQRFDFMGRDGAWYCLLSARTVCVNVRMMMWGVGITYMDSVGIVVGDGVVGTLHFRIGFAGDGRLIVFVNRDEVFSGHRHEFPTGLGGSGSQGWAMVEDHAVKVNTGSYLITVIDRREPRHFDVFVKVLDIGVLSDGVWPHGIIGQSADPIKEACLEGTDADYEVGSAFGMDFKFDRFGHAPATSRLIGFGASTAAARARTNMSRGQ